LKNNGKCRSLQEDFRFGRAVQMIANRFRRLGDENLSNQGINICQLRILSYLHRNESGGPVYQRTWEDEFGIRRSSVTSVLQNMEKNGYLVRESSPADARTKCLRMTEKGKELDRSLLDYIHSLEEAMMDGISPEERQILKNALLRMLENLEKTEKEKE